MFGLSGLDGRIHTTMASFANDVDDVDMPKLLLVGSVIYSGLTTALHPLNVVKTREQAFSSSSSAAVPIAAVRSLVREQGVRGLYAGLVPVLAGAVPARAGYILALEGTRPRALAAARGAGLDGASAEAVAHGCAGFAAAVASLLVYVPADVVSQRMMVADRAANSGGARPSLLGEIRAVHASAGVAGFFRGFWVSAAVGLPAGSIWWAAFGWAREFIPAAFGPMTELGATAAAAATVAAVAPLDTIKVRTQLAGVTEGSGRGVREPVWQMAGRLVRRDGILSLWAGSLPRFAHLSLWGTALITVYEQLKHFCRNKPPPRTLSRMHTLTRTVSGMGR